MNARKRREHNQEGLDNELLSLGYAEDDIRCQLTETARSGIQHILDILDILEKKRKLSLGQLINECKEYEIVSPEYEVRFSSFTEERHWLVHRSMVNNGNDLYLDSTRNAIFGRISVIEEEAGFLKNEIFKSLEKWVSEHGLNLESAYDTAEKKIKNLKGE